MQKRKRSAEDDEKRCGSPKRIRLGPRPNLLHLSDEVILRILSCLTVRELLIVERVSRRLLQLATDPELWKSKFYETWVRSRARRLPISAWNRNAPATSSLKLAKWLEHGQLLRDGIRVDWKRQYKIRSNWDIGAAKLYEVEVAKPPALPVLAKVHKSVVFTVDSIAGLRAWSQDSDHERPISQFPLDGKSEPTSIAVDADTAAHSLAIGYRDGSFSIFTFRNGEGFVQRHRHNSSTTTDSAILSMALAMPYVLTMTSQKHVALYHLSDDPVNQQRQMTLLATLHSEALYQPTSVSIRKQRTTVVATIAYPFCRLNAGWCIGLQEIRLSIDGGLLGSRLASTIDTSLETRYQGPRKWEVSSRSTSSAPFALHPQLMSAPTSLSYSHPFLIAGLADNTIMCYIITSDDEKLEINSGRRLWGHTSAVSGAEVSNRGKAVSVSARGHEIRIWELEDVLTSVTRAKSSTRIKPDARHANLSHALAMRGDGLGLALKEMKHELAMTRRWVDFDDEQVVVLGERDTRQIMACYDFT